MFKRDELLRKLNVQPLDSLRFQGENLEMGLPRVYGAQGLAQALSAAAQTVDPEYSAHSLHGYFLRPGDTSRPIIYEAEPIRNGRSFSARRVTGKQDGEAVFDTTVSFQRIEEGLFHQFEFPKDIPHYSELADDWDTAVGIADKLGISTELFRSQFLIFGEDIISSRTYGLETSAIPGQHEPKYGFWFKFNDAVGDDPIVKQTLLAFISDKALMGTCLQPHPVNFRTQKLIGASLDHAIWFHDDIKLDQWIYYLTDSPRAGRARGFNRGSFYTEDGQLICSTAQEGLIRIIG